MLLLIQSRTFAESRFDETWQMNMDTLEKTDKTDGKLSGVSHWVISKDGKSMRVEFSSTKRGQTMRYRAEKLP